MRALLLAMAGLLAVAPAAAGGSVGGFTFVHSAESGQLQDGRLILRGDGIGRRVTWLHNSGRSGMLSVARMHRALFGPRTLPATGALHVAGLPPGREPALRLSRPRHSVSGDWVSYRVRRLSQTRLPRRFDAASLSLVGGPRVGERAPLNTSCPGSLVNNTAVELEVATATKWDTDSWDLEPTIGHGVRSQGGVLQWLSEGGFFRGCSNTVTLQPVSNPSLVTFTITTTLQLGWMGPAVSCTASNPAYGCTWDGVQARWVLG